MTSEVRASLLAATAVVEWALHDPGDESYRIDEGLILTLRKHLGMQCETTMPSHERRCQAMNDCNPSHAAEVVCNRDGMEWFSCSKHAPKSVETASLREWLARLDQLDQRYPHKPKDDA